MVVNLLGWPFILNFIQTFWCLVYKKMSLLAECWSTFAIKEKAMNCLPRKHIKFHQPHAIKVLGISPLVLKLIFSQGDTKQLRNGGKGQLLGDPVLCRDKISEQ